jgi:L,D-transpeptidase YbiS
MLHLKIMTSEQKLWVVDGNEIFRIYAISTSRNGLGEQKGSGKTPRGWHTIRAKIGSGCPADTVFVGRRPTGETYSVSLAEQYPDRDWILTRILWLSGLEQGKNRLGNCDSMQRFIYIHGCPDRCPMGMPLSHGCIRMRNQDIIALFDLVVAGTQVLITH